MYPGHPGRAVSLTIERTRGASTEEIQDVVAAEEPLEIRVAQGSEPPVSVSITMRTPGNDFELAIGFLCTEGIIRSPSDVEAIAYAEDALPERRYNVVQVSLSSEHPLDLSRLSRNFYTTSSCGVCGKASLDALHFQGCRPVAKDDFVVAASVLQSLPDQLRHAQEIFDQTGGLHAAGLFSGDGKRLSLQEDVGRHNALDKLIGASFLGGELPLERRVLMLSGRASFELVQKAVVARVSMIAAVGAPSSLAVDAARDFEVTLVGFLRRDGFNVYTGARRICRGA